MGIKPGELGGHTVPGLKSSYQGEPVEGEVRKAGKADFSVPCRTRTGV